METLSDEETRSIRAITTYQLLFAGPLVIRDSDYLNTFAFRRAMTSTSDRSDHDDFFHAILHNGLLEIAFRTDETIRETAAKLLSNGRTPGIDEKFFSTNAPDLDIIDNKFRANATFTYSNIRSTQRYTSSVIQILGKPLVALPDAVRMKLLENAVKEKEREGTFTWRFLNYKGGIWNGVHLDDFSKYRQFVFEVVGHAPSFGDILLQLALNPVYMIDVAESIDLWRDRESLEKETLVKHEFKLGDSFSFSDYGRYLSRFSVDDIVELVNCDERLEFTHELGNLGDVHLDKQAVLRAYKEYRRRIDKKIMSIESTAVASGVLEEAKIVVRGSVGEVADWGVGLAVDCIADNLLFPWKFGLNVCRRLVTGEWPETTKRRKLKEEGRIEMLDAIDELQQSESRFKGTAKSHGPGKIDMQVEVQQPDVIDTCISKMSK